jgi:hypothetical protein
MNLEGYRKRGEYPDDGAVVTKIVDNGNGTMTVVYDDMSYLVVRKVKP